VALESCRNLGTSLKSPFGFVDRQRVVGVLVGANTCGLQVFSSTVVLQNLVQRYLSP
jgi:hypothetical protein